MNGMPNKGLAGKGPVGSKAAEPNAAPYSVEGVKGGGLTFDAAYQIANGVVERELRRASGISPEGMSGLFRETQRVLAQTIAWIGEMLGSGQPISEAGVSGYVVDALMEIEWSRWGLAYPDGSIRSGGGGGGSELLLASHVRLGDRVKAALGMKTELDALIGRLSRVKADIDVTPWMVSLAMQRYQQSLQNYQMPSSYPPPSYSMPSSLSMPSFPPPSFGSDLLQEPEVTGQASLSMLRGLYEAFLCILKDKPNHNLQQQVDRAKAVLDKGEQASNEEIWTVFGQLSDAYKRLQYATTGAGSPDTPLSDMR